MRYAFLSQNGCFTVVETQKTYRSAVQSHLSRIFLLFYQRVSRPQQQLRVTPVEPVAGRLPVEPVVQKPRVAPAEPIAWNARASGWLVQVRQVWGFEL